MRVSSPITGVSDQWKGAPKFRDGPELYLLMWERPVTIMDPDILSRHKAEIYDRR